jgi:hypothetical protein
MARYILDVSKANLEFLKDGDPLSIPCRDGENYCDLDVIEEDLPPDFVERMRDCCLLQMAPGVARDHWEEMESMPVGFDTRSAYMAGAVLIKVSE